MYKILPVAAPAIASLTGTPSTPCRSSQAPIHSPSTVRLVYFCRIGFTVRPTSRLTGSASVIDGTTAPHAQPQ